MFKIPNSYDKSFLEYERIHPVFSSKIKNLINDIINGNFNKDFRDNYYSMLEKNSTHDLVDLFKTRMLEKILSSKLNNLKNLELFTNIDVCLGCTQYIDNLYLYHGVNKLQILSGEYRYHQRLYPSVHIVDNTDILKNRDIIISLPFVNGNKHTKMNDILDKCFENGSKLHIDCAWITASKNIDFDFSHPSIESIGFSLSKGFGLGWNRIGIRLQRNRTIDSIKIMNDHQMIPTMLICIANHFIDNLEIDHLWNEHSNRYDKICTDFNLKPTSSIHVALDGNKLVGTCNLIRYLENVGK
jgi:hypothetical protein